MNLEDIYRSHAKTTFSLPIESQLLELESRTDIELPADYRRFLLEYNGGFFKDLRLGKQSPKYDFVDYLSGIGATYAVAELGSPVALDMFVEDGKRVAIQFGRSEFGNLLVMNIERDDLEMYGSIYGKVAFENDEFFFIADSFLEFITTLIRDDQ